MEDGETWINESKLGQVLQLFDFTYASGIKTIGTPEKVSKAGTEIGKHSVETLNRDQTRIVVENLLDNRKIGLKDLQNKLPEGILNTFKPIDTMKNGVKYEFQLSDGTNQTLLQQRNFLIQH